jgi:phage terminase large subunit-like protein
MTLMPIQSQRRSQSWAQRTVVRAAEHLDCPFWAERNFHIEDRADPQTGAALGPGPIILADHQRRILRAALERDGLGRFRWTTVVWSCPKKSGKTRIAAAVAAWLAESAGQYAEIYCLANDGKQSADRVLAAVKKANNLGALGWHDKLTRVELPNGSFIEAVPVDPTGEAGANPTASLWSEMWGFRLQAKERLWSEFTIPPTRQGKAIRWVESYAGFIGESPILEQLYDQGVTQGKRHPSFPDLPVYVNERAKLFCYWDHEPRMAWQTKEYYAAEAALLTESEFQRIHRNQWVTSETEAIPIENWDRCFDPKLPPLVGPQTPVVIGVDLGVSGDSTAMVMVSRHPNNHEIIAIRGYRVWQPPKGGKIDYSATIEPALRDWCQRYNVVAVAYDEYQAHKMMTDLRREGIAWFVDFPQGKGTAQKPGRPVADKMTYDLVMSRKLAHGGDPTFRQHVQNAAGKVAEERYMRFVKKAEHLRIDLLVAASMAIATLSRLNV